MKLVAIIGTFLILGFSSFSVKAQLVIPGTNLTVTTVNDGTGSLVSIPIPGDSGLSITVGQGSAALPLQNINNLTDSTRVYLGDDGWHNVPLGFTFQYWGQPFDTSTMYSNGAVQFGRPVANGGYPNNNAFCCHGSDLTNLTNINYNYSIMPMWTDLTAGSNTGTYYRGNSESMTYGWYDIKQYGTNNSNTFELKINNTGTFDVRYGGTFVAPTNGVTIGMTGDLSKGEYLQFYNGLGFQGPTAGFSWGALSGTGAVDQCIINPLSLPTCPGYQAAYTTQQCSISALYDVSCPGYQSAYFNQQCSANSLYDRNCPGYETAYFSQQCSLNTLYNVDCPGYASAYLTAQCRVNPLYSTTCDGYAAAYKTQQCTANPLYATDCPGYEQAYLNAQCIIDSLYSNRCEGYATAYAIKYLVSMDSTTSNAVNGSLSDTAATRANDPTTVRVPTNTASTTVSSDGTVSTGVSATGDTNVDKAINSKSSTTNTAPAAVQLAPPPPPPQQMAQSEPKGGNKQEDKKDDAPKGTGGSNSPQNTNNTQTSSNKPAAPTARQELQARREAAAKAEAVEKGKNLANEMGKAADMEAQKQIQNVVIQAMGFTPGFDTYSKTIMNDVVGYKPYSIYNNQKNIDNRANLRMFGGTDRLHNDMVESQYNLKRD
jgi:hypothetical protein